jgi:uncharacterized protein YecE (DUF72 family)
LAPRLFIGTSGWAYSTWKPEFYPQGVSQKKFLQFYSSQLTSVEVNYTFGSELKPGQLQGWLDQTGTNFRFSFKAPQRITHFNRLRESHAEVAAFFDALKPAAAAGKLGLVLFQLPPNFKADLPRLRSFLAAPAFRRKAAPPIAFEFRHESWFTEETYALLRRCNAGLCIAETDDLTTPEIYTAATHTCFRLRRAGGYEPREIAAFAKRFQLLAQDRDVYIYFRHEDEPTGALNAAALLRKVDK